MKQSYTYLDVTKITVPFIFFWSIWVLTFSYPGERSLSLQEKKRNTFFLSKDKLTNHSQMFCVERNYSLNNTIFSIVPVLATHMQETCNFNFTDCGVIFVSGMGCSQPPNCPTLAFYSTICALPRHCLAIRLRLLPSIPKQTPYWAQKEALSLFCSFIGVSLSTASD